MELLVTDRLPVGVMAEPTQIRHVGSDKVPDGTYLLLRDDRGLMHDVALCDQFIECRHVFGALFRDETGTVWAARQTADWTRSGEVSADWPLEQVSAHTHPTVAAGFGQIIDSLPAMGELVLTNEIPARVAWIPWWSGFGSNPREGVVNTEEDTVLAALLEEVRAIHASGAVVPDPAPTHGPKVLTLDGTIQEHEVLVTLHDWRPDEEVGPDDPGNVDLRLTLRADQLLIDTPDGRQIMIELEGDQITAHAYNDVSESPASLRLRCGAPIEADATAHLSELYQDEEGPSP